MELSKSGKICLTDCYPSGYISIHPVTLKTLKGTYPYCAVRPFEKEGYIHFEDECQESTKKKINTNLLYPITDFEYSDFLKEAYNIETFEDTILFIKNNPDINHGLYLRLLNVSWKSFGLTLLAKNKKIPEKNQLSDIIVDFYYNLSKINNIDTSHKKIRSQLEKYIEKEFKDRKMYDSNHHFKIMEML